MSGKWMGEITKADLEMAVFLSAGEVDRYRIMLEHDIRAFELMDPEIADADTVRLPWCGTIDGAGAETSCASLNDNALVIPHVGGEQGRTDETRHVYRAPVM